VHKVLKEDKGLREVLVHQVLVELQVHKDFQDLVLKVLKVL
jgi:hypothetical protein